MPNTITVPIAELRNLVTKIIRFACDDKLLPIFNTVKIETRKNLLVAYATDRYRLGFGRASVDGLEPGFSALVSIDDWREMLKLFPKPRRGDNPKIHAVQLTVDDHRLTATQPNHPRLLKDWQESA